MGNNIPDEFKMSPIPEDKQYGWTVKIDGEKVHVSIIELGSKFGTLTYGQRPEGYDSWVFKETGGGGSNTIPYSITPDGELLIALVKENRSNMGGEKWCAIGGFVEPKQSHFETQQAETAEEASLDSSKAFGLPGAPGNCNRLFFVANPDKDEGLHAYGLEILFELLEPAEEGLYKLKDAAYLNGCKKPENVRFMPWNEAIEKSPDVIARGAIAQLMAYFKNRIKVASNIEI